MGLLWLTALSIGVVIAAAPPQTIPVKARVCAVVALASFGLGAQVAQADGFGRDSVVSQITCSTIATLSALAIPVAVVVARRRSA